MAQDYSRCWASCLGDCAGVISREHLISECLFPSGAINVHGFAWCKDIPKTIGVQGLTGRILCQKHNSALSEVDSGVKYSLDTICEAVELFAAREKVLSRRWNIKRFTTDMYLLERWCLKTLINFNVSQEHGLAIDPSASEPRRPTEELVKVAFGVQRFGDYKGLYAVGRSGQQVTMTEGAFNVTTKTDGVKLVGD